MVRKGEGSLDVKSVQGRSKLDYFTASGIWTLFPLVFYVDTFVKSVAALVFMLRLARNTVFNLVIYFWIGTFHIYMLVN